MKISCFKVFATSVLATAMANQLGMASTNATDVENSTQSQSDSDILTSKALESLRGESKNTSLNIPSRFTKVAAQTFKTKAEAKRSFQLSTGWVLTYPDKPDSVKEVIFRPEATDKPDSKSDLTLEDGSFVGDFERIVFENKNLMFESNAFYGPLKVRGINATEVYTSKIQQIEIIDCCLNDGCSLCFLDHFNQIILRNIKKLPRNFFYSMDLVNIEGLCDVEEFGEGCFEECGIPLAVGSCLLQTKTYPSRCLAGTYWVKKDRSKVEDFSVNWIIPKSCESIGREAFKGSKLISYIGGGEGLQSVGHEAFASMPNLEYFCVDKDVSYGHCVFDKDEALCSVCFGEGSTCGDFIFMGNKKLLVVQFPKMTYSALQHATELAPTTAIFLCSGTLEETKK